MSTSKGELLPSLFSTRDEAYHANLRRSVNNAFSMSSLVQYEPMVDETTELFLDQTDRLYASTGNVCDFARWLQYFAFDVIGSITYSKRHGFIEENEDIDGIIAQLANTFDYAGPVGQMPWLDMLFWKNPILMTLSKWGLYDNSFAVATFASHRMQERLASKVSNKSRDDLLTMFLKARDARPEFMTEKRVLTMAVSMAFAGSETTAISLSSVFYYLLKNPRCLQRLREELDTAVQTGTIENRPTGLVSWTESQTLPYLDACIKESFRIHPPAGLPLERIVPPQGVDIAGHWVPGGTIVGSSAWVIHRREEIFGPDVDVYRPERWLEAGEEQLKAMNGNMIQFGMGSRTCIGKNISLMEVYKLVPSFLRRFDVRSIPFSAERFQPGILTRIAHDRSISPIQTKNGNCTMPGLSGS
jgi:cytochrome P450